MRDEVMSFEYKRGDEWSVLCLVTGYENIKFIKQQHPEGASMDLKIKFLEEAERAVLHALEKE